MFVRLFDLTFSFLFRELLQICNPLKCKKCFFPSSTDMNFSLRLFVSVLFSAAYDNVRDDLPQTSDNPPVCTRCSAATANTESSSTLCLSIWAWRRLLRVRLISFVYLSLFEHVPVSIGRKTLEVCQRKRCAKGFFFGGGGGGLRLGGVFGSSIARELVHVSSLQRGSQMQKKKRY